MWLASLLQEFHVSTSCAVITFYAGFKDLNSPLHTCTERHSLSVEPSPQTLQNLIFPLIQPTRNQQPEAQKRTSTELTTPTYWFWTSSLWDSEEKVSEVYKSKQVEIYFRILHLLIIHCHTFICWNLEKSEGKKITLGINRSRKFSREERGIHCLKV